MRTVLQIVTSGKLTKVSHWEKYFRTKPTQTNGHVNTQNYTSLLYAAVKSEIIMKTYLDKKK